MTGIDEIRDVGILTHFFLSNWHECVNKIF